MPKSPSQRAASSLAAILAGALSACQSPAAAESVVLAPAAMHPAKEAPGLKTAIFSGGCFWGVSGVFVHVKGVTRATSGYQGGALSTAQYERVSDGDTGHAESVRVTYDPAQVRYDQLLRVFFSVIADPTELNRQGPDSGTQYRSALVPLSAEQRAVAADYLGQLAAAHVWKAPIVTRIEPYKGFFAAEGYHQSFMARNPGNGYIQAWDAPKLAAFQHLFPALYKLPASPA